MGNRVLVKTPPPPASPWYLTSGVEVGDAIAVYRFKGAESEALALTNLVSGNNLNKLGSPAWSQEQGFSCDYANCLRWYNPSYIPTPANALTFIAQYANALTNLSCVFLGNSAPAKLSLTSAIDIGSGNYGVMYGADESGSQYAGVSTKSPRLLSGNLAMARNTTTKKVSGYRDGILEVDNADIATNPTSDRFYLGVGAIMYAFAMYSKQLDATQMLAISTAMALL